MFAAANQARFEDTASHVQRLLKNVAEDSVRRPKTRFPRQSWFWRHAVDGTSQFTEIRQRSAGFVLNAPRSSAMCC